MRRYHITVGATTTAGGTVISASSLGNIDGQTIALEGDAIACPSCESTGRIVCTGPRIPETWGGKSVALENDYCACGCSPPPRLVANQRLRYQAVEGSPADADAVSQFIKTGEGEEILEQFFEAVDQSGNPVDGYKFDLFANNAIHTKAGRFAGGKTVAVDGPAALRLVMWVKGDGGAYHG